MIAVDANITQELLESRSKLTQVIEAMARYGAEAEIFAISTLTASHVFYLSEAHKIAVDRVEELIAQYNVYDVVAADVTWAFAHYSGKDFEDALQVAAARREKCTTFMTLDASLAKKYDKFLKVTLIQ